MVFDSKLHYAAFDKTFDHPNDTKESALCITDAFFCLPFLLTPTEKGLYGGPSTDGANAATIVSTPQGIGEADKSIHEFQASNQTTMLVVERTGLWRVRNRMVVAMCWRVS